MFDNDKLPDEAIINKLYKGWEKGFTDSESCIFCDISPNRLKQLYKTTPNLESIRNVLQTKPTSRARQNVIQSIDEGNIDTSKWYLERKAKDEFSTKQITEENSSQIDKKLNDLQEFMETFSIPHNDEPQNPNQTTEENDATSKTPNAYQE